MVGSERVPPQVGGSLTMTNENNDLMDKTIRWLEELSDPDGLHDGWHDVTQMAKLALDTILDKETEVVYKASTQPKNWSSLDWEEASRIQDENREALRKELRKECDGVYVGEIVRFGVADGYAEYMIKKERPLQLIWLTDGDSYQIHPDMIRGLTLDTVKRRVEADRKLMKFLAERDIGKVL